MSRSDEGPTALSELLGTVDESSLPENWEGGEAFQSGGGMLTREFTNEDAHLQVSYSPSHPDLGVGLYSIVYDDQYDSWIQDEELATRTGDTDTEQFAAAIDLMQETDHS